MKIIVDTSVWIEYLKKLAFKVSFTAKAALSFRCGFSYIGFTGCRVFQSIWFDPEK